MVEKQRLLAIPELNLAGKIEGMDDEQMYRYEQLLILFIENFPSDEERIKAALHEDLSEGKNYIELENKLYAMCKTLGKLHADDLSTECRKQIDELKGAEREQIEANVTGFLNSVAMLSIDIQMAKYLKTVKKAGAAAGTTNKTTDAQGENTEKTILAVDDAAISLIILEKNLQGLPYKLICVNSGNDALRYLERHQPDLFILDIEMPEMDGYELAEKIRGSGQEAPIVFLAGNATRRNVKKAMDAGASDFIVKPINKKHLVGKLQKYL